MSEKSVVFISHSSLDKELAHELKRQIEQCLNAIEVFAATIEPGENWFEKVIDHLNTAEAFVLLITPNSVDQSHWVWFELGYFWSRHDSALESIEERKKVYYPLYVDGAELPNPVKDLKIQAASLKDRSAVTSFFQQLCKHFEVGGIENVDIDALLRSAEKVWKADKLSETSIRSVLSDFLRRYNQVSFEVPGWFPVGEHIIYEQLDRKLGLPRGTSKKYLKPLAQSFGLNVSLEEDDGIRFGTHGKPF